MSILLVPHCCFKQFLSRLPTQIPAPAMLRLSSYATFHPSSLLFPASLPWSLSISWGLPLSVLWGFLHPSLLHQPQWLEHQRPLLKAGSFILLFSHPNPFPPPLCLATDSHGHILNPIIKGGHATSDTSSLTSYFQFTYYTYTARIFQIYLDISVHETHEFLPSITTPPHSAFTSFPQ